MILCGWPIKKLPLSGNCFASSPLRAGPEPGRWRQAGTGRGGCIVGEGGRGVGGTHWALPLMNGAFLERIQSPIHSSPRGTSLNKYGQGFSPSGSHRCQSPNANKSHKGGLRSPLPNLQHFWKLGLRNADVGQSLRGQEVSQTRGKMERRSVDSRFLTFLMSTQATPSPTSGPWSCGPKAVGGGLR